MTSLRDGRDLREYSPLVYFEVFLSGEVIEDFLF